MFGKNKEKNSGSSFQRNTEYSVLAEGSKSEIEDQKIPEIKTLSARLSSDTQLEGTIKFDGIMRIDGNVNGEISTDNGELVVSELGVINATIMTKSAVIDGRVDGNIIASNKVVLKQKAHLTGNLQAKTLVIEKGVVFIGRCNVNPEGAKIDNVVMKDQPQIHHIQQKNVSTNERNTAKSAS
ncbi:MAG: polymer-forming cytoskeletal protein [Candidatus Brocadiales bacterium]|nr:polymer-forming cytoskeletal protein [Candidatus Brocadiales bacterium]